MHQPTLLRLRAARLPRALFSLTAAAAIVMVPAFPAQAANSCTYDAGSHTVTVSLDQDGDPVMRVVGGAIRFEDIDCGSATTSNTDTILVGDGASDTATTFRVHLDTGDFAPGFTPENDGKSEIEFVIDLDEGGASSETDAFRVEGSQVSSTWEAGQSASTGEILVALDDADPDVEVSVRGVDSLVLLTGDGDDTIDLRGVGGYPDLALRAEVNAGGGANRIFGGLGNDDLGTFTPEPNSNEVHGGLGNDKIWVTSDLHNELVGDAGDDDIRADGGTSEIHGGDGDDAAWVFDGQHLVHGGPGDDQLDCGHPFGACEGPNRFWGGTGNDAFSFDGGENIVRGGTGGDRVSGGPGVETVNGDEGNDVIYGGEGDDVLFGGPGRDTVSGDAGADRIAGGDGPDTLIGKSGPDDLTGGDGIDTLQGNRDADTLDGGDGDDVVLGGTDGDRLLGAGGSDVVRGGFGDDVTAGGPGDDRIVGGDGDDHLYGQDGDDALFGQAGMDTLFGGAGSDELFTWSPERDRSDGGSAPTGRPDICQTSSNDATARCVRR